MFLSLGLASCQTEAENDVYPVISAFEAAQMVYAEDIRVIDVRTPEEFEKGHIRGASLINYHDKAFETQLSDLPRDEPLILHCQSGGRSGKSEKTLRRLGFENIHHLEAGFKGWSDESLPAAYSHSRPVFFLKNKIQTQPGKRTELIKILESATQALPGNLAYEIFPDNDTDDIIWIFEEWESADAHNASLQLPAIREFITEGRPLIRELRNIAMGQKLPR